MRKRSNYQFKCTLIYNARFLIHRILPDYLMLLRASNRCNFITCMCVRNSLLSVLIYVSTNGSLKLQTFINSWKKGFGVYSIKYTGLSISNTVEPLLKTERSYKKRLSISACQLGLFKERILLVKGTQTIFSLRTYANRVQLGEAKAKFGRL